MKVLLVTSKYLPNMGGLENAVHALDQGLKSRGHQTLIVTNRYSRKLPSEETIDGTQVIRCYFTSGLPSKSIGQFAKYPVRLAGSIPAYKTLQTAIEHFQPDIVNLHYAGHPTAYVTKALSGRAIPLVLSLHGDDVEVDLKQSWVRLKRFKAAVNLASAVTSNSRFLLEIAAKFCPEVSSKGVVVGNGFSATKSQPLDIPLPDRYIMTAGRLVKKKGIDLLFQAAASSAALRDIWIVVAGDGPERSSLEQLAVDLGLHVKFLGSVEHHRVTSLMSRAAVFCQPSRSEAFGLTLVEAMSEGAAIVASDAGGIPEVLDCGNRGYLFPSEDTVTLAHHLETAILKGPPLPCDELRNIALTEYTWDVVVDRYVKLYLDILNKK